MIIVNYVSLGLNIIGKVEDLYKKQKMWSNKCTKCECISSSEWKTLILLNG